MCAELLIFGIFCPPFLDVQFDGSMLDGTYTYSIDMLIATWTILRIYLITKIYRHFSIWLSQDAFKLGRKFGVQPTVLFAFKADLKYRPQYLLGSAIFFTVIGIGYAVRNLERSYVSDTKSPISFEYLTNGWWLTVVTMATVGYGDGYPSTHLGRFIMIITAVLSLVVISLYVVALTMATVFTKEETKAFYSIKKDRANTSVQEKASNVIKAAILLKSSKTENGEKNIKKFFIYGAQLRREIHYFKYNSSIASTRYLPPQEMLLQLEQKLVSDVQDIRKELIDVEYISERLHELMQQQQSLNLRMDFLLSSQNELETALILFSKERNERRRARGENDMLD
mmetsp:Transcript_12246/g.23239  ORF Transcript_12246/g.23239 Transcript_12246/m.23239 type:complete len:340 (+) Transcript_12246:449-1468(+)